MEGNKVGHEGLGATVVPVAQGELVLSVLPEVKYECEYICHVMRTGGLLQASFPIYVRRLCVHAPWGTTAVARFGLLFLYFSRGIFYQI